MDVLNVTTYRERFDEHSNPTHIPVNHHAAHSNADGEHLGTNEPGKPAVTELV